MPSFSKRSLLAGLALGASTIAYAGRHPQFSWHTVPVFAETSNVTGFFDDGALDTLAKFPLYVAEKAYAYPEPGYAETKLSLIHI